MDPPPVVVHDREDGVEPDPELDGAVSYGQVICRLQTNPPLPPFSHVMTVEMRMRMGLRVCRV